MIANIKEGFNIALKTIKDYFDEVFWLMGLNGLVGAALFGAVMLIVTGVALHIPPIIVLLVASLVALISAPPLIVGLYYVAHIVAQERAVTRDQFITGIKTYWRQSYAYTLGNLFFIMLMWNSLNFYMGRSFGVVILGLWLFLTFYWVAVQFYYLPVLFEQNEPRLLLALRNTNVIILQNWAITLVLVTLWGIIATVLLYFFFPGMLFMLSWGALAGNEAIHYIVEKERKSKT